MGGPLRGDQPRKLIPSMLQFLAISERLWLHFCTAACTSQQQSAAGTAGRRSPKPLVFLGFFLSCLRVRTRAAESRLLCCSLGLDWTLEWALEWPAVILRLKGLDWPEGWVVVNFSGGRIGGQDPRLAPIAKRPLHASGT